MAKYLDYDGLTKLWAKIKNYAYPKGAIDYAFSLKADESSLSAVATSGSYNDLSNKPAIPDVSVANLTKTLGFGNYNIGHTWGQINSLTGYKIAWGADLLNGGEIAFGEANGRIYMQIDGDYYGDEGMRRLAYIDELPNISGKADKSSLASVATSGSYNDLSDKPTIPTIPTKISAFENDKGYKTLDDIIDMNFIKTSTADGKYATKTELDNKISGYIKNMTRIWQNGTAGISVGSVKNVNIQNLRPAGATVHDTVIATSKDSTGRGTFCTTYYEVTGIDSANDTAELTSIGNYYSYDLPSNGTQLGTINGNAFYMGQNTKLSIPTLPSWVANYGFKNSSSMYLTNIFAGTYYKQTSYSTGGDYMLDISITGASFGSGNWYATASMAGVNDKTGSWSTQFTVSCSIYNSSTIRVWFHCISGSNSSSTAKLYCNVVAIKYY